MPDNQEPFSMFDRAAKSPSDWLFLAYQLRNSASRVDWLAEKNIQSIYEASNCYELDPRLDLLPWRHNPDLMRAFPVYRMLMGYSFENLLKGIRIAQGTPAGADGKLENGFKTHGISELLKHIVGPHFVFSSKDRELLSELERFVIWQGRYPISTREANYSPGYKLNDPKEHQLEIALWDRLRDHLASIGWHLDANGNRYSLICEGPSVSIAGIPRDFDASPRT